MTEKAAAAEVLRGEQAPLAGERGETLGQKGRAKPGTSSFRHSLALLTLASGPQTMAQENPTAWDPLRSAALRGTISPPPCLVLSGALISPSVIQS